MSRRIALLFAITVFLLCILIVSASFAREHEKKKIRNQESPSLFKPTGEPGYQILNINNLWTWMRSDGYSNHSPKDNPGTFFPRWRGAGVIYLDGIMWGGKCYTDEAMTQPAPYDQTIRVGGSNYLVGTRVGRVIGMGATATAADPNANDSRIFRIRRDYASMSETQLRHDAAEYFEIDPANVTSSEMDQIIAWYERDWKEWPVDYGAPFIDRNGNGVYDPPPAFSDYFTENSLIAGGYDEPGIGNPDSPADQVIWTVYNDLDREQCIALQGSYPMGLEVQVTIWGYKRTDALGNCFFRRARIINKGGVDVDGSGGLGSFWIDSMYVAQWADPDVGARGDDLVGCDTHLNMGYAYNGNTKDSEFIKYGLPPPAVGYDILAGPIVPSPGDVAVFDLKYKQDWKNLGMTAFSWFSAGSALVDPPSGYEGCLLWYKTLRGYVQISGPDVYYPFPPGVEPDAFPFNGDPVNGTGFIDGLGETYSFSPGDRRMSCSTGPFTLAPGDTQEVVVAVVCGLGADRLSSISVMKFNDRFAQAAYDGQFQVPSPPSAPKVTVTELDGQVILEWGSDLAHVLDTETTVHGAGGYVFEGYNVYQFPRKTSSLSDAVRIAVYDLPDDPTVILDEQFDVNLGIVLRLPVQFGSNSGIKRYFEFDRDYVLDVGKIYNGQEYYLSVTAYSRSTIPGYIPAALESAPIVLTVVPKVPFGTEYNTVYGDTLDVEQVSGTSDGIVLPIVVDPAASTGDTYEVTFEDISGGVVANRWILTNTTDNEVLLTGQENLSGDLESPIVDGIYLKVSSPPLEGKSWDWTGDRWFSGAGYGELLYGGAYLHPTWTGSPSGTAPKTVEVRFVAKTGYTDSDGNGAYTIGEPYKMPAEYTSFTSRGMKITGWVSSMYPSRFGMYRIKPTHVS